MSAGNVGLFKYLRDSPQIPIGDLRVKANIEAFKGFLLANKSL
jgi:hypothetical protein